MESYEKTKLLATEPLYKLRVEYDDTPLNPRTDYDNFGKMVCWHSRYNLGDKHEFDEPRDFLIHLASDTLSADEVIDFVKNGGCNSVKLEFNREKNQYVLKVYNPAFKEWFYGYSFDGDNLKGSELAKDAILEVLPINSLKELAERNNVILPLYLYDHSGITISCSHSYPYNDRWDAGQVGWTYAGNDDIKKEYGVVNAETIEQAKQTLIEETDTFDDYLRGDCYGYIIEKNGVEVESCWGYLGDLRKMISEMKSNVCKEYQHLFDHIDYCCMEYSESAEPMTQEKPSVRKQLDTLKNQQKNTSSLQRAKDKSQPEIV